MIISANSYEITLFFSTVSSGLHVAIAVIVADCLKPYQTWTHSHYACFSRGESGDFHLYERKLLSPEGCAQHIATQKFRILIIQNFPSTWY